MTFTEIVARVVEDLNLSSSDATARVGRRVNERYKALTTLVGIETSRNILTSGNTAIGSQSITFTSLERVDHVYWLNSDAKRVELTPVSLAEMNTITAGASDAPTKCVVYQQTGTSTVIKVDALAETVYTMYAEGASTVSTLSGSDVPAFPVSFHDILVFGAKADELDKMEKYAASVKMEKKYEDRKDDLVYFLATDPLAEMYLGKTADQNIGGSSSGGAAPFGTTAYTQTGLVTFDRDPDAPFAVTSGSAMVDNLIVDANIMLVDSQAQGDLLYASSTTAWTRLAKSTTTTHALLNNGSSNNPAWGQVPLTSGVTGTLPVANGGTGLTSATAGDILYASATDTWAKLAKNTSATRYLSNTGASNIPAWAQIDLSNGVTGVLPGANGGKDVFNVKAAAYGALGDDATNDAAAIALAVTAASNAGGGIVYFPKGTYRIGSAITVPTGVYMMGVGKTAVIKATGNFACFNLTGSYNKISHLYFVALAAQSAAGAGIDFTNALANISVEDCWFGINLYTALKIQPSTGSMGIYTFRRLRWDAVTGMTYGIMIGNGTNLVSDVHFEQCSLTTTADMVACVRVFNNSDTIAFSQCEFVCFGGSQYGFLVGESAANNVTSLELQNTVIEYCTSYGMYLLKSSNVKIIGCNFQYNEIGLLVDALAAGTVIANNCFQVQQKQDIVLVNGSVATRILGNLFTDGNTDNQATTPAISVNANVDDFQIIANRFGNDVLWAGSGNYDYAVIVAAGTSTDYVIKDNIITGMDTSNVVLDSAATGMYPSTLTQGDLLYSSAADKLVALAKDTNATRYLANTGTSNNPAWAQVALATGVSGSLPVANLANGTFTKVDSTATGATNNWAPGLSGNTVIYWNGASDIAVTGIAGGVTGQLVTIKNITTTKVATFAHASGSSSVGNKLTNLVTSGVTPVAPGGYITYQFDATTNVWQLVAHEQGAWITPTFDANDYTGNNSMTVTVASGDVTTNSYRLVGKTLHWNIKLVTITVAGTPSTRIQVLLKNSWTTVTSGHNVHWYSDNGGAFAMGMTDWTAAGTTVGFWTPTAAAWNAATNTTYVAGCFAVELT